MNHSELINEVKQIRSEINELKEFVNMIRKEREHDEQLWSKSLPQFARDKQNT